MFCVFVRVKPSQLKAFRMRSKLRVQSDENKRRSDACRQLGEAAAFMRCMQTPDKKEFGNNYR